MDSTTRAVGIESKAGKNRGAMAHPEIAEAFRAWLFPEVMLEMVKRYRSHPSELDKLSAAAAIAGCSGSIGPNGSSVAAAWCEGTFAIQKRFHNFTCVLRRVLEAAEDHRLFLATTLKLKRMIRCPM